jgi:glycosyltransferase involved in cell wall biosynthesis
MRQKQAGNLLMVSNYPSDTAYAWWLMEHFWRILAKRFIDSGRSVYLAYPTITTLTEAISTAPIETVELTIPWKTRIQSLQVKDFLREKGISAIYFTDQPYFNLKYAMMRLHGVKSILVHDHTPGDRPPALGLKGTLKAAQNLLPWFTADRVICVSELMRKRNMTNTRIPAWKCDVVQNGIHPVNCKQKENTLLRESLGVRPDSFLIISTGRAHPFKRFDFIIECADALRQMAPGLDAVFLLAGDGVAMPALKEQVQSLDLENSVRLLGFRNDIRDLLCMSDIALHAALGEGFSLSIVEYMSAGLPVLVPDIPSVSQAIQHNETGILYPKDETDTVASHIVALATDTGRRLAMGNAARAEADGLYSLEKCTESFLQTIEKASLIS